MTEHEPTARRLQLLKAGYMPIPLFGKAPPAYGKNNDRKGLTGWQTMTAVTAEQIELWGKMWPGAVNTGVLTQRNPASDIDILMPEAAQAVEDLARERFEERGWFLTRFGKSPKRAILLRTTEPFRKITLSLTAPNGDNSQKIEILGEGQQLVVDGIHPETHKPYMWFGGEPWNIPSEELPYVSEQIARDFLADAQALLVNQFGYKVEASEPRNGQDNNAPRADWSKLVADIHAGRELHNSTCTLAAKLVASGMADHAAGNLLRSLLQQSEAPRDQRWQDRLDDVGNLIRTARGKFGQEQPQQPQALSAQPWWRDPATIPPREFLHGKHYIRKNIGASIGAGGRAKTTHALFEAIEMAYGFNLSTKEPLPKGPLRALVLNAEEDQDELDRRAAAVCQYYHVTEADLGQRLIIRSLRKKPLRLATIVHNVPTLNQPDLNALDRLVRQHGADVFMLDPWVSFHAVNESVNADMDLVIKEGLGTIAENTNSAGEIFHHPGKPKPGQAETTVEDARGASAIIWAVRSARVFNFMSPDEAGKLGIAEADRRKHVRVSNGKANMGPIGTAEWIKIVIENLPNGDEVAYSSRWIPPNPFEGVTATDMATGASLAATGVYRADSRSPAWFGYALADIIKIPVAFGGDNKPKDTARLNTIIKTWVRNKVIKVIEREDEAFRKRKFIVPGSASPAKPAREEPVFDDDDVTLQ